MIGGPAADSADRFVLREIVGSGAMGSVHRAVDRRSGATVAFKKVVAGNAELLARFDVEAAALAALEHPGIVRLVAHGVTFDDLPFLAMEWLEGEDLAARLERGALSARETAILGAGAASALATAHQRGIVHRDVKPANLFLCGGAAGRVKLIDFGLARIAGRALTATGTLLGTPGYFAPEQARGAADVDGRADLFSLGAVLFECLSGGAAFPGEHMMAVLAKVLLEEAPRLRALCPEAPPALTALVDRMLAKDPGERPQSAAEVASALEGIAAEMEAGSPLADGAALSARVAAPLAVRERRFVTVLAVRSGAALADGVEPFGGRVDRLANGTLLVTWTGAEDPAERIARAARCALMVRSVAPSSNIAVATGLHDAGEERPIGQALDRVASLLEGDALAPGPGIRLDSAAAGLLDPRFHVASGPSGFELLGEEEISKGARPLLGRRSPFAGREREMRLLLDLVDDCAAERAPRVVLVTAPAGAGKSRLVHELRRVLEERADAPEVWVGRGDCMSAGAAFAAIGSVLRNSCSIRSGDPLPERQRCLDERVARRVAAAERGRVAAFLGELAGVHFSEEACPLLAPARRNPALMGEQMRRAWQDFVAAECAARPLLLVLDDLHWGDTPTVNLLQATLGGLTQSPLCVLALGRPETGEMFPALRSLGELQEVRLGGLSPRAAGGVVRAVLGDSIDAGLSARIVERAGGNAFYLEEMIRAAAAGTLSELPETVLATVQARLDVLPAEERAVLLSATVFGEVVWQSGVMALLEGREVAARTGACLKALVAREILTFSTASRYPGERELVFRHALLRDGAYALLGEPDRAAAHLRAAEWLEEMGEDNAVLLAEHYEHALVPERAARHRLAAAEQALAGNDLRAAVAHAERASPAAGETELRIRRAHLLNESYCLAGDSAGAAACSAELIALAPPGSEPWCNAVGVQMMLALESGSAEQMHAVIETFMGAPIADRRSEWIARVYAVMSNSACAAGLRGPAAYFLAMAEKTAESDPPDLLTQWFLCMARAQQLFFIEGDLVGAVRAHESALASSEQSGKHQFDAFNHGLLSWIYIMLGALAPAEEHARTAMETSPPAALAGLMGQVTLAWLATARGMTEEAIAFASAAFEAAPSDSYMRGMAKVTWGYTLSMAGRWAEVEPHTQAALQLLAGTPSVHPLARVQQCDVLRVNGRHAEALRELTALLASDGSFVAHPMAIEYARKIRIAVLAELGDEGVLDAALREERARILAAAAKLEPSLRAGFLEITPWNVEILAKAAERLGD